MTKHLRVMIDAAIVMLTVLKDQEKLSEDDLILVNDLTKAVVEVETLALLLERSEA